MATTGRPKLADYVIASPTIEEFVAFRYLVVINIIFIFSTNNSVMIVIINNIGNQFDTWPLQLMCLSFLLQKQHHHRQLYIHQDHHTALFHCQSDHQMTIFVLSLSEDGFKIEFLKVYY